MATDAATRLMTTDEFLQLADEEGVTHELIDGVLEERPVTTRSGRNASVIHEIQQALNNWWRDCNLSIGVISDGDVLCRLAREPDTVLGVDVVFYDRPDVANQRNIQSFIDGPPTSAIKVVEPKDRHGVIVDVVHRFLSAGTKQVWIADPDLRTVTIYRPDTEASFFNAGQKLTAEPELPGFHVAVKELFVQR